MNNWLQNLNETYKNLLQELTDKEAKVLKKADTADKATHKPGEKEPAAHNKFHKTVEGMVKKKEEGEEEPKKSKKDQEADDHNGEGALEGIHSQRDEKKTQMQSKVLKAHEIALNKAMSAHDRKLGGKHGTKCEKSMFDMYMKEFENNMKDFG